MKINLFIIISLLFQLNFNYFAGAQTFNTVKSLTNPNESRQFLRGDIKKVIGLKKKTNKVNHADKHRQITNTSFRLHLPLNKIYFTSYFGKRFHPVLGRVLYHNGVDIRADYKPVYSISKGVVERICRDKRSGNYVVINNFNGIETVFCHLAGILVKVGDTLIGGAIFAISGATGLVTGPHLHFGLKVKGRFVDPKPLLLAIERHLNQDHGSNCLIRLYTNF